MNQKENHDKSLKSIALRNLIPMLVGAVLVIFALILWGNDIADFFASLLTDSPLHRLIAALVLLLAYSLKPFTIVIPLTALYLIVAFLFPAPEALLINIIGLAITVSIPYFRGYRKAEDGALDELTEQHPKLASIRQFRQDADFHFVLLIRILGVFSCDLVSLYMGMAHIKYPVYLAGCLLGYLPGLVTTTFLGSTIDNVHSPAFWISLTARILVFVWAGYIVWRHRAILFPQSKNKSRDN